MDIISKIQAVQAEHRISTGYPFIKIQVGADFDAAAKAAIGGLTLAPDPERMKGNTTQILGMPVVQMPSWWPADLVALVDRRGRPHMFRLGEVQ